jgi:UDP-N-acetylglucosamine 2-epimerase
VKDIIIHTGQHYDSNMSDIFFTELGVSSPNYNLQIGSGIHGEQTGAMLAGIEKILLSEKPDRVLVYGDTNSTLAGALAAVKLNIPVAHIEAGLRSYNRAMPEEINRVLTDQISDLLFVPNLQSQVNLQKEGITNGVHVVGDVIVDLLHQLQQVSNKKIFSPDDTSTSYFYVTLHRPYNTDNPLRLQKLLQILNALELPLYFSLHPRTKSLLSKASIDLKSFPNINFIPPQGYIDNIHLLMNCKKLITDSGGLQKEAYVLKKPCITLRSETEWKETLVGGWNILCFARLDDLKDLLDELPDESVYVKDLYGKGDASDKISAILESD